MRQTSTAISPRPKPSFRHRMILLSSVQVRITQIDCLQFILPTRPSLNPRPTTFRLLVVDFLYYICIDPASPLRPHGPSKSSKDVISASPLRPHGPSKSSTDVKSGSWLWTLLLCYTLACLLDYIVRSHYDPVQKFKFVLCISFHIVDLFIRYVCRSVCRLIDL